MARSTLIEKDGNIAMYDGAVAIEHHKDPLKTLFTTKNGHYIRNKQYVKCFKISIESYVKFLNNS